jgi:S-adenosylmethionine hydrolase
MIEVRSRIIGLLTDFGAKSSHYVASMKGVILNINPNAKIIDIIHNLTPYSIIEASYIIKTTYNYYPENSIFIVVIDPGVGSPREILTLKTESNYFFVGPNNGIFSNCFNEKIVECFKVENDIYFHKPVSKTFHGRDIMAPVGAYISDGVNLNEFGPKFDLKDLTKFLVTYEVLEQDKKIISTIQYIDSFGNITTNIQLDQNNKIKETNFYLNSDDIISFTFKDKLYKSKFKSYFATVAVNSLITIRGSSGYLEISVNQGNAAKLLDIKVGDIIKVFL